MENCKFSYYKKEKETDRDYLYCNKTNEICPLVRFCNKLNKIISVNNYKACNEYNKMNIPKGKNKVRFVKNGKLIVELYDKNGNVESCIEIDNPFKDEVDFVEIININEAYYVKGYEPTLKINKRGALKLNE